MRPAALAEHGRQTLRVRRLAPLREELQGRGAHLADRLARHVAHDQRLVVAVGVGLLQGGQDGGRRPVAVLQAAELRIDGTEHGVAVHDDLVGGQGDQRAAGHGVVRHEDGDPSAMAAQRVGDLVGGEHEPAGRVQDQVDGRVVRESRGWRAGSARSPRCRSGGRPGKPRRPSPSRRWMSVTTCDPRSRSMERMSVRRRPTMRRRRTIGTKTRRASTTRMPMSHHREALMAAWCPQRAASTHPSPRRRTGARDDGHRCAGDGEARACPRQSMSEPGGRKERQ